MPTLYVNSRTYHPLIDAVVQSPLHSLWCRKPNNECLITAINRHQLRFQPFGGQSAPPLPIFIVLCPFVCPLLWDGHFISLWASVDPQSWIRRENEIVNLPMVGHAQGSGRFQMVFARDYDSILNIWLWRDLRFQKVMLTV